MSFPADKVRSIALNEIQCSLSFKAYEPEKVEQWCEEITSNILARLAPSGDTHFKFVAHCIIADRAHEYDMFSNNFWDESSDGIAVADFENDSLMCCVTVWGVIA